MVEPTSPLRVIVIARSPHEHVRVAWEKLQPCLMAQPEIEVVGVAMTDDVDHKTLNAELAIVLGGDGSILRACRQFEDHQIPILPVNLGKLGFLADLTLDHLQRHLDLIATRQYKIAEMLMFEAVINHQDGSTERHLGLNELAIRVGKTPRMIDVSLAIDGDIVTTYSGDGLILATPVGSTAHNLSAGGPILKQTIQAFVVTPICPHTLTIRPIVEHADCTYEITLPKPETEDVLCVIDGHIHRPIQHGDSIQFRRADVNCKLVRLPDHSYYETLHRKLGWDGQLSYQSYHTE